MQSITIKELKSTFAVGGQRRMWHHYVAMVPRVDIKESLVNMGITGNSSKFSNVTAELLPKEIYTKEFKPAGLKSV
jgi:hypothetical protein